MICNPKLIRYALLYFNHSLIVEISQLWFRNLQTYCPQFNDDQAQCRSHCLYSWDMAEHLHFVKPYNFRKLNRCDCSWLATGADI